MQTGPIVSLHAAGDVSIPPHTIVAMAAGGVVKAAADARPIGIVLPGDLERNYPTVQLFGFYVEGIQDADEVIAVGDELELAANGLIGKKSTGDAIGVAVTAGGSAGGRVDAIIYGTPAPTAST